MRLADNGKWKTRYVGRTHDQSIATAETFSFRTVAHNVRLWGPLIALVLLCFGFGIADPSFATIENLKTIASRASIPTILAIGMTFIII